MKYELHIKKKLFSTLSIFFFLEAFFAGIPSAKGVVEDLEEIAVKRFSIPVFHKSPPDEEENKFHSLILYGLPEDIWVKIFDDLSLTALSRVPFLSKDFNRISQTEVLWKKFVAQLGFEFQKCESYRKVTIHTFSLPTINFLIEIADGNFLEKFARLGYEDAIIFNYRENPQKAKELNDQRVAQGDPRAIKRKYEGYIAGIYGYQRSEYELREFSIQQVNQGSHEAFMRMLTGLKYGYYGHQKCLEDLRRFVNQQLDRGNPIAVEYVVGKYQFLELGEYHHWYDADSYSYLRKLEVFLSQQLGQRTPTRVESVIGYHPNIEVSPGELSNADDWSYLSPPKEFKALINEQLTRGNPVAHSYVIKWYKTCSQYSSHDRTSEVQQAKQALQQLMDQSQQAKSELKEEKMAEKNEINWHWNKCRLASSPFSACEVMLEIAKRSSNDQLMRLEASGEITNMLTELKRRQPGKYNKPVDYEYHLRRRQPGKYNKPVDYDEYHLRQTKEFIDFWAQRGVAVAIQEMIFGYIKGEYGYKKNPDLLVKYLKILEEEALTKGKLKEDRNSSEEERPETWAEKGILNAWGEVVLNLLCMFGEKL